MGDSNHSDIGRRDNTVEYKQSRRFLDYIDDTFPTQVIEKLKRRGVLLDLILSYEEGLVGDVKVKGCLGCSDHGIV
ncbi:selenoprotein n [Limosa lapponica baueri]|uniref:Selenoprotein n n=1 Tax=Limosa lapponica baueri TaxID=1758121 RepID=A0A2I0UB69_LIMLA|nr:selenoprotein n [Limosa lapponica baueri]